MSKIAGGISFHPNDQVKGGLIDDVNGILRSPRFRQYTYPNTTTTTLALVGDVDVDGDKHEQAWSVGNESDYEVLADGKGLKSLKGSTGSQDNSNFSMFMRELMNADKDGKITAALADGDISVLDDLNAHWIRKAQPKRAGLQASTDKERTTLVPDVIHGNGAKRGAAASRPAAGAKPAAAAAPAGNDLENDAFMVLATDCLENIRAANAGKTFTKAQWNTAVLSGPTKVASFTAADQPTKDGARRLLKNAEFLAAMEVTVAEDGSVSL